MVSFNLFQIKYPYPKVSSQNLLGRRYGLLQLISKLNIHILSPKMSSQIYLGEDMVRKVKDTKWKDEG